MDESKRLMKILKRIVDPNKDIDIPALHDKIMMIAREELLKLPKPNRDGYLNPTWATYLPFDVSRQDNSLVISETVATISDSKKRPLGYVSRSLTGYMFVISEAKTGGVTLTLNCRKAVEWLFNERASFKKTRKKKLVKKEAA